TIPAGPGEDPVIPGGLRGPLAPLPDPAERALTGLHAPDWAIRSAGERLARSTPRVGLDGSQREPSSLFVEAAAALRRPAARGALGPAAPRRASLPPARDAPPAHPADASDARFPAPAPAPGLSADHPISASGLERLLSCPHRFLYERLLH